MLILTMNAGDFIQVGDALIEYAGQSVSGTRRRQRKGPQIRVVIDLPRAIPVHRDGPYMDTALRARCNELRAERAADGQQNNERATKEG